MDYPTEEAVARAFASLSKIGEDFGIVLPGDDSVVPFLGPTGELDFRVSDSEVVLHELSHLILRDIELKPSVDPFELLRVYEETADPWEVWIDELRSVAMTMAVMNRFGLNARLECFLDDLATKKSPEPPHEDFDATAYIQKFARTHLGKKRIERLANFVDAPDPVPEPTIDQIIARVLESNESLCMDSAEDRVVLNSALVKALGPITRTT